MNKIRKNPPEPAPSRIAGTLKLRKAAQPEDAQPARDDGRKPAARAGRPAGAGTGRPSGERAERHAGAGRSGGTREGADSRRRDANPGSAPRREREAGAGERRPRGEAPPSRRGDGAAAPGGRPPRSTDTRRASEPAARPARADHAPAAPRPAARVADTQAGTADGVRLSKVMAERGICSRREADELIERGWVFVDGKRISELGTRIASDARITLAPEATRAQAQRVTILLHKPVGYVSGQPEPGYEPAVALIGADNQYDRDVAQRFHPSQLKGLAPAGRLDIDSTGLLVLTQDGRIARKLIGDDSKVEKEYLVRVEGKLAENGLALLNHGLWLDDRPLREAKVEWLNDDQLRFVLREGRKRQIRRMCELVGLKVVGLKRVRIGRVRLGDLPLGQWRYLRDDEAF